MWKLHELPAERLNTYLAVRSSWMCLHRALFSQVDDGEDFVGQVTVKLATLIDAKKANTDLPFMLRNLDDPANVTSARSTFASLITDSTITQLLSAMFVYDSHI